MKKNQLSTHKSTVALLVAVATMAVLCGCTSYPKRPNGWSTPSVSISSIEIVDSRYANQNTWREDAASQLEAELTKCGWFRYYQTTNDVDYFISGAIKQLGRSVTIERSEYLSPNGTNWVWMTNRVVVTTIRCNVGLRYFEPASRRLLATGEKNYSMRDQQSFPESQRNRIVGEFPVSDAEYQKMFPKALHSALVDLLSRLKAQFGEESR